MVCEQLERVRHRIEEACQRAHRPPRIVTLIGVTKGVPVSAMQEALACGLRDLGENRVQEAAAKHEQLGGAAGRWHLIGHLQRNKARHAARVFDVIHSVDSLALVDALEREAAKEPRAIEVFIQINISGEATKHGCRTDEAETLSRAVLERPHLALAGLMAIPPLAGDPEAARPHFRALRELRDALQMRLSTQPPGQPIPRALRLSMGMSSDFEIAVEEGADLVRVGTAIFGPRA